MPCSTFRFAMLGAALATIAAARGPETSWGRAGIPFDQYRTDAVACGRLGANTDIADQPATAAFVAAENWNERNLNAAPSNADPIREQAQMVQRLRPAKRITEVQQVLMSKTEQCLTRLGYRQFTLTSGQAKALRRLATGTPARHAYLHQLASDPAILAAQSVRPPVAD